MKRILIIIFGLWSVANAQTVTPNPGQYQNISTKYQYTWQKWIGGMWNKGKFIQEDSAQFLGEVYVPGALQSDSSIRAANTAWVKKWISDNVTPGIPGQASSAWSTSGNWSPVDPTPFRLGFKDAVSLHFITNNTIRATIPYNGIVRSSGAANRYLTMDTTTNVLYYADGSAGGGNLQAVTDAGNTTTNNVRIIDAPDNQPRGFRATSVIDGSVSLEIEGGSVPVLGLNSSATTGTEIVIDPATDQLNTQTLQNKSGVVALLGDLDSLHNSLEVLSDSSGFVVGKVTGGKDTVLFVGTGPGGVTTDTVGLKWPLQAYTNAGKDSIWNNTTTGALTHGATTTWDYTTNINKTWAITGNSTLAITNDEDGSVGVLLVTQDGTGGRTITFPVGDNTTGVTQNTAAGAKTMYTYIKLGSTRYWNATLR